MKHYCLIPPPGVNKGGGLNGYISHYFETTMSILRVFEVVAFLVGAVGVPDVTTLVLEFSLKVEQTDVVLERALLRCEAVAPLARYAVQEMLAWASRPLFTEERIFDSDFGSLFMPLGK